MDNNILKAFLILVDEIEELPIGDGLDFDEVDRLRESLKTATNMLKDWLRCEMIGEDGELKK